MSSAESELLYRDVQTRKPWFAWPVIALVAGFGWWLFIQQIVLGIPFTSNPPTDALVWILWAMLGVAGPGLLWLLRLIVEVRADEVVVRYVPIYVKRFPMQEIESAEVVTYRPMREWLGWGIRWIPWKGWAYTISGDRGVALRFRNGGRVLIGIRDVDGLGSVVARRLNPR